MFGFISTIVEVVSSLATSLPKIIEIVGQNLILFSQILNNILKDLKLISPDQDTVELGDKVLQAENEGITAEKFDSYEDYLKAVEKFEINSEKSLLYTDDVKIQKGIEIFCGILIERFGQSVMDFFMQVAKNPDYFATRLPFFTELQKKDPATFSDMGQYIAGKNLSVDKSEETLNKFFEVEKKINPDATITDLMKKIDELKD